MLIKIIKGYRNIVAICDSDLIGRKFEQGKFQLDLTGTFFKGKEVSEKEAIKIIQNMQKEDATFNIVGQKSINTAVKAEIILEKGIKKIQGVPFALLLL
ncbi:MAG: DUF424 family protein [Nanoarchaeota archaeon]